MLVLVRVSLTSSTRNTGAFQIFFSEARSLGCAFWEMVGIISLLSVRVGQRLTYGHKAIAFSRVKGLWDATYCGSTDRMRIGLWSERRGDN